MLEELIGVFARLPGLGPRSARRIVLHLIRQKETALVPLTRMLQAAGDAIVPCEQCGNLDVTSPCAICADPKREQSQLCVVEEIADLWAMERSHMYHGLYHVLGGTLSAIDGRGPAQLLIDRLVERAAQPQVTEVILATNATVEGQMTAHYISERLAGSNVAISQLARGIPVGAELDYLDEGTLGTAFRARGRM